MRLLPLLATSVLILSACSPAGRQISGRLDLSALGHTQAEAVALRSDGTIVRAPVASDGRFVLSIRNEGSYAMAFRDPSLRYGGHFAHVVFSGTPGKRATVRVTSGEDADLGDVAETDADREDSTHGCAAPASSASSASGGSGGMLLSVLVHGEHDLRQIMGTEDGEHEGDALQASRGDDRPDELDDDPGRTGTCVDHPEDDRAGAGARTGGDGEEHEATTGTGGSGSSGRSSSDERGG